MEVQQLAEQIRINAEDKSRYIVAISGPPAAGKSTYASELNEALKHQGVCSKIVPMDGFHLDNSILTDMGILERKGSPSSFDALGFLHLIRRLASANEGVYVPAFNRKRDISIACADLVSTDVKVLIIEGNYLLLNQKPWSEMQQFWDETVFIKPELTVVKQRLIQRWLDHGFNKDDAEAKASLNDLPNAEIVLKNSYSASIELI